MSARLPPLLPSHRLHLLGHDHEAGQGHDAPRHDHPLNRAVVVRGPVVEGDEPHHSSLLDDFDAGEVNLLSRDRLNDRLPSRIGHLHCRIPASNPAQSTPGVELIISPLATAILSQNQFCNKAKALAYGSDSNRDVHPELFGLPPSDFFPAPIEPFGVEP
jgi:hypothetical protein